MKKIITSLFALLISTSGKTQTNEVTALANHTIATCAMIYSEDIENMISQDASAFNCSEIVIQSLPPLSHTYTPLTIDFAVKGHYTFIKDASLEIPSDHRIYFEDNLTGQVFDLSTSNSFTFMVNRSIPKRFTLRVEKKPKLYAKTN
jgi:hypothetical protein